MRKTFTAILSVCLLFVALFPSINVRAIEAIRLRLYADTDTVNRGDVLAVKLATNRMPHIISFENIGIDYDENSVSFMSYTISGAVSEDFAIIVDDNDGSLKVSGNDESAENFANEWKLKADEDLPEQDDISFFSEEAVELCTLYFRVKVGSYDTLTFVLDEEGSFLNSKFEKIDTAVDENCSYNVTSDISSEAHLLGIKINGTALADFEPDTLEYTYNVSSEVANLKIDTELRNNLATVSMSDTRLVFGDNTITIEVTAQDGETVLQYLIYSNRQASYTQEGACFTDHAGQLFYFVSAPDDLELPRDFKESTTIINDFEVPCYVCEGVEQILLYVFDADGNTGMYFYDARTNKTYKYDPNTTFINKSSIMKVREVPPTVDIPEGFTEAVFPIDGGNYKGYVDSNGRSIIYLENEAGDADFYKYDFTGRFFSRYEPVDNRPEKTYHFLFTVCLFIAIIEAVAIILIVYFVRRLRKERVNPRPRRV